MGHRELPISFLHSATISNLRRSPGSFLLYFPTPFDIMKKLYCNGTQSLMTLDKGDVSMASKLFTAGQIGTLTLPNRVIRSATQDPFGRRDGHLRPGAGGTLPRDRRCRHRRHHHRVQLHLPGGPFHRHPGGFCHPGTAGQPEGSAGRRPRRRRAPDPPAHARRA